MTRQEFTDAVAEVLGLHPGVEMQIDTITRLADAYASSRAADAIIWLNTHPEETRRG